MEKIILTDGGRYVEGFIHEKLDCSVRAVALARRMPYKDAHTLLAAAGRKPRHKFKFVYYINTQDWARQLTALPRQTVRKFLLTHDDGNYIVRVTGHVFAVCGGIALDTIDQTDSRAMVRQVWEVKF